MEKTAQTTTTHVITFSAAELLHFIGVNEPGIEIVTVVFNKVSKTIQVFAAEPIVSVIASNVEPNIEIPTE